MGIKFTKTELSNGLTVHLKEIHSSPLVSHWLWYRVGSRDEIPGKTGISHWVEHMQFKGTEKFPSSELDKTISREGGVWNASTSLDWTAYYEKLPSDKIDLAMELESDRMVNSIYDPEEVEAERTVIISEREGHENEPMFKLDEAIQRSAFDVHPYRYEVIGDLEDLHKIQRDDLYRHYRTYYVPNNAVLAIAGDFDTQEMLDKVRGYYEAIPSGPLPPHPAQLENPLSQERKVDLKGPGETSYLKVGYRAPAASDPDFFAFTVLDSILAGPASLNMFGGGNISNKTSRLYRSLVEKELAVAVGAGFQATAHPFLYDITVICHPGQKLEDAISTLDGELNRLQDKLVLEEEIARAVKQARALFVYGSENITNQAFWLGYAEMFDTYNWFVNYVSSLEKITPADVQRVARDYLMPEKRVVGTYIPDQTFGGDA